MKIFDFSKVMFNVSKGKLVAQHGKLVIPTPINSTNCPTVYAMSGYTKKDSDGKEYPILDGSKKIPVCMATENFKVKKGTFEGEKAFLGIRVYLGSGKFDRQELYAEIPYSSGVVNSDGDLVFEYDFPVFEYNTGIFYYLASYNSDSGEGEKFIQNGYFTKMIVNVSGAEPGPIPPEPTDPIEEYTVQGVSVEYTTDGSSSESYIVSWDGVSDDEDWFDDTCQYEVTVKHGETIIDTISEPSEADGTTFYVGDDYLDNETYIFEVRVVKGDKKSLPGTTTDTYRDPFHDETIDVYPLELDIPEGVDTNGYELNWSEVWGADKYEVYLDGVLYKTTTSSSIIISDKDPGQYNLEIKAYNHKNTMIFEKTSIQLYDPMDNVTLEISESDIEYNSDDTISISNLTAYYNGNSLPKYLESRLTNNDSLEISIDGDKVYTGEWNLTVSEIDVSNLEKGEHELSFKLTTTYGGTASSEAVPFNVDRCGLIDNDISSIDAWVSGSGDLNLQVTFKQDVSETDRLTCSINSSTVSVQPSGSGFTFVIYSTEFDDYDINPGETNTIDVEVSCDIHDESISGSTSVYIPVQCQLIDNYLNASDPSDSGSDFTFEFDFGNTVDEPYTITLNGNTVLSDTTDTSFTLSYDELINSYGCDYGDNSVELGIECEHDGKLSTSVNFYIPEPEEEY